MSYFFPLVHCNSLNAKTKLLGQEISLRTKKKLKKKIVLPDHTVFLFGFHHQIMWACVQQKVQVSMWAHQRLRSACLSGQSDHNLCLVTMGPMFLRSENLRP